MAEAELKPCPFCGGSAFINPHSYWNIKTHRSTDHTFGVVCEVCNAQTTQFFYTDDEAIEAWNRRATNDKTD